MTKPKPKVGRPARVEKRPAKNILGLRLTKRERARLDKAAGYKPTSVWGRIELLAAADRILGPEDD